MKIIHEPKFEIDSVVEYYTKKDGVPIRYVCSSECSRDNEVEDIFYRETPHPEFGNRYFGLIMIGRKPYIRNADSIENKAFACVENDDGDLEYSRCRWDYKKFKNGNMIDGGRAYIRHHGKLHNYKVRNGEMIFYDNRI
jgi:hypothetical protein